jgi:prepilin-type N-terminal cleavage/methylation domain-containing protein
MRRRAKGQGPRLAGSTLIELLVVLAIVGVVAGVAGLSFRAEPKHMETDEAGARVAAARRQALRIGRSVTVAVSREGHVMVATAHADGRVVADSALSIDRLSGRCVR